MKGKVNGRAGRKIKMKEKSEKKEKQKNQECDLGHLQV
jgi:hypothetical protein